VLRRRFADIGVTALEAVPAFTGLYPFMGGYGNFELLFTRHRLLVRTVNAVQVWSAWSGPTPIKLLAAAQPETIVISGARHEYTRVRVTAQRLWVFEGYLDTIARWAVAS
jgi:hypothetical protein